MSAAALIAWGACSALGEGVRAVAGPRTASESAVVRDPMLSEAGLRRPFAARGSGLASGGDDDRATLLLRRALAGCFAELDEVLPSWRTLRIGAAIGTSSGGMGAFERGLGPKASLYLDPVLELARPVTFEPFSLVLGACASSAIALGLGRAWLLDDRCDLVLAGGFDAVSVFVAAGFECLRATTRTRPEPFRKRRDGLALGEGAAIVALVRPDLAPAGRARAFVTGFGASCDAVHLTAPDRSGEGLARAARRALADSGEATVDLVSAHGTATPQNDAAEAGAIRALGASGMPVHAMKGAIGHTLGAAAALEVLGVIDSMEKGILPPAAGEGPAEEGVGIASASEPLHARRALKLSSAFGGANAALVVDRDRSTAPPRAPARRVFASPAVAVTLSATVPDELAARTGYPVDRVRRADDLVRLSLAAVAALVERIGGFAPSREDTVGIVVGHGLATIATNLAFLDRIRSAGAARAEPRRFPYTTPNAAAGECAVAFGLRGPAFAVGGGPHGGIEALAVARDLVGSSAAEAIVVVAVDAPRASPEGETGAVALLLEASARPGFAELAEATVSLHPGPVDLEDGRIDPDRRGMAAHAALRGLVGTTSGPRSIVAERAGFPVVARAVLR